MPKNYLYFEKKDETLPWTELVKVQEERIKKTINQIWNNNKYLSNKLKSAGFKPDDFKTLDDIKKILELLRKSQSIEDIKLNILNDNPDADLNELVKSIKVAQKMFDSEKAEATEAEAKKQADAIQSKVDEMVKIQVEAALKSIKLESVTEKKGYEQVTEQPGVWRSDRYSLYPA